MRLSLALVLALSGAVAACSSAGSDGPPRVETPVDPATPPAAQVTPTSLPHVPCRFLMPKSAEGDKFYCADVEVPEDRRDPASRKIKIHVAVIKGKQGG